jgi:hypothetical protein
MDMQAIKDEIILKLTGDVTALELSDASLTKIINSALRETQRYIDTVKFVTIPYSKCVDMKPYKVNSVIKVMRAEGYMSDEQATETGMTLDPLYASQWQILTGTGNVASMQNYVYNLASWNTIMQIRNTTSTDMTHLYDKMDEKLYINVSSNLPPKVTIMYIPRFDDVSQITSDFWIDILVRMSVAIAKTTVGRVRSKFKQSNALWVMDGDALIEEGNTEMTNLRQELKDSTQLVYGID